MTPFSISQIHREPRRHDWLWTIDVNWPSGSITFSGSGFRQTLRAEPVVTQSQVLERDERRALPGYHPLP